MKLLTILIAMLVFSCGSPVDEVKCDYACRLPEPDYKITDAREWDSVMAILPPGSVIIVGCGIYAGGLVIPERIGGTSGWDLEVFSSLFTRKLTTYKGIVNG